MRAREAAEGRAAGRAEGRGRGRTPGGAARVAWLVLAAVAMRAAVVRADFQYVDFESIIGLDLRGSASTSSDRSSRSR